MCFTLSQWVGSCSFEILVSQSRTWCSWVVVERHLRICQIYNKVDVDVYLFEVVEKTCYYYYFLWSFLSLRRRRKKIFLIDFFFVAKDILDVFQVSIYFHLIHSNTTKTIKNSNRNHSKQDHHSYWSRFCLYVNPVLFIEFISPFVVVLIFIFNCNMKN